MTAKQIARPYTKLEFDTESLQYCVELWFGTTKLSVSCYDSQYLAEFTQSQIELAISLATNQGVEQIAV